MVDIKKKIKEILSNYPGGIHFNDLAERCEAFISRATLSNRLKDLERDSEISHTPQEPRRGQKIYYRLTESFIKINKELKKLDEQGDIILNDIYMLHYCLEKGYVKDNSLVDDFAKSLFDQFGVLFMKADNLGRPFPEKYQRMFYDQAFEIFKNANLRYISILKGYPENRFISFELHRAQIFLDSKINYDDYLDWLEKSDDSDYRRIGLFIEK